MLVKGDFCIENIGKFVSKHIDKWNVIIFPENKKYLILDDIQQQCFLKLAAGESIGKVYEYYINISNNAAKESFQQLISKIIYSTRKYNYANNENGHIDLIYDVTYKCNSKCIHCFINEFPSMEEVDIEQWIKISDKILSNLDYKPKISISGGEPLLFSSMLKDLISYLKNRTSSITILTNGLIFADWIVEKNFKDLGFYLENISDFQISLDGFDNITYDKIRGKGCFEKVLKTLLYLNENKKSLYIHTTVSKLNAQSIVDSFVPFLKKYDLYNINNHFSFSQVRPVGSGRILEKKGALLSSQEFEEFLYTLYDQLLNEIVKKKNENVVRISSKCGIGKQITVSPNGNCYLCGIPSAEIIGNILKDDFNTIYGKLVKIDNELDQNNFEACFDCELKGFCNGGCRISNKLKTGNYTTPFCTEDHKNSIYRRLIREEVLGIEY